MTLRLGDTRVASPTLTPELRLHLLTPDCPAWRATEPEVLGWPYWAVAWPGGQALARYLLDAPQVVRGRRVLDFGAGGAVEGLAAMKAGAASVVCADIDARAGEAALANAALNGVRLTCRHDDVLGTPRGDFEVVLAGDVCFEPALALRVITWLRALAAEGALVLLGDVGRVPLPREALEVLATYLAPHDGDVRGGMPWETTVARVRPAGRLARRVE